MKLTLIRYAIMAIKLSTYGLVAQMLTIGVLFAFDSNAQYKSISDTYIEIQAEEQSLKEVINIIESDTDFTFFYLEKDIDKDQLIKIDKKGSLPVFEVLMNISKTSKLKFRQVNNNISVTHASKSDLRNNVEMIEISLQGRTITGKVTSSEDQEGLPGVNVIVKGTSQGTVTDVEGNYSLEVPGTESILVFSSVGYVQEEIVVGNQTVIDLAMVQDITALEEIVVIGYGQKSINTITGAVSKVTGEVLESRPITNTVSGLQGTLPGLTITRSSGQPGQENYNLQVRGSSSTSAGGNSPLVLIDGIEGNINNINPNDIESTVVLKDASAAIYGARAAGGVVLITTKTGGNNKPLAINYNGSYSLNQPLNFINTVNMQQYAEMQIEAVEATGGTSEWAIPEVADAIARGEQLAYALWGPGENARIFTVEEDWKSLLYKDFGSQWNHNLNIIGGGANTDYNLSVGYVKVNGILKDAYDEADRINLRLNYGFNISDNLRLKTKLSYENLESIQPAAGVNGIFNRVVSRFVWLPNRTEDGSNYLSQWGQANPRQLADKENGKWTRTSDNLNANILLEYDIIDGLTAYGQLGVNKTFFKQDRYGPVIESFFWGNQPAGLLRRRSFSNLNRNEGLYKNFTGYLDYRKEFNQHMVGLMVGASHENKEQDNVWAERLDYTQNELWTLNLGSTDEQYNNQGAYHWAISSLYSRLSYSYKSKYNAEVNYRRDGTSVFHRDVRWGDFYGAALSWRASEEDFIKNLGVFDNLKFRLSRGTSGNQDFNEDDGNFYDYIALIDQGGVYPFGGIQQAPGAWERKLVSQIRTWEEITTSNLGVDFAFLDSRLFGTFDIYKKRNENMLLNVNLPAVLGGAPPQLNVGTLETKGFELSLGWQDRISDDFSYSVSAILDDNTNKLVDLDGADIAEVNRQYNREGYAIGTYFGYEIDGFIQNQEELDAYKELEGVPSHLGIGDAKFKDLNNDGRISAADSEGNDADIVDLGTNVARYNYAFNVSAKYKGFDFSAFIQGVAKRTIYYHGGFEYPWVRPWLQPLERFYGNTWTPENPDAKYPRLTMGDSNGWNYQYSSMNRINGAYIRLKNIQLGYTIPNDVSQKAGLQNVRFYFSGEDLFTLSHVDGGYDPENTDGGHSIYPFMKRFALGLSLTF
ncbi:MAG: TonB-dependent receptor [Cytophagales bacterium]|nr:TonB-dependent receptor [Cytophagales bacterium]